MTKQNKETEKPIETAEKNMVAVPEKFKKEDGSVNVDALLKSYLALEKKLSEKADDKMSVLRPEKPEDYQIEIRSPLMKNDLEINKRLFELGLSNEQAQGIYDLAADKIIPILETLSETFRNEKDLSELENAFGGAEQFNLIARQISSWGEKNLDRRIFETLASSKDGIMAMYKMMCQASEPSVLPRSREANIPDSAEALKRMMQDPKYWKQQDPELMKRVEDGFKRLYG